MPKARKKATRKAHKKKKVTRKAVRKKARKKHKIEHLPYWPFGILIFVIVFFFDQITKKIVETQYILGQSREVFSWLWFTYVQNTGATWGIFRDSNDAFIFLSLVALGLLIYYYDAFALTIEKICYTLLLSGIIGNLLDRLTRGFVVDFIDLGFWPVFNLADSAIVVGIVVYVLEQYRKVRLAA